MSPSNGSAMVVVPLAAIAPAILDTQQAEGGQVPVIMPTSTIPGPLAEQPVVHVRCVRVGARVLTLAAMNPWEQLCQTTYTATFSVQGQESQKGDKLAQLEVGDTVFDENAAMEPKKKGRFLVMEQVRGWRCPAFIITSLVVLHPHS
eukprot:1152007-Pelagomonas_calceolata.AAC.2